MKQFFKFVLATITGVFILGFIFFIVIMAMVSSGGSQKVELDKNSVLEINLNYDLPDRTSENPFEAFAADLTGDMGSPVGLYDVLKSIEYAKTDDKIKGIFLDLTFIGAGYGKLGEVRDALEDFKTSGKFIYAYAEVYYNQTYYFASVADKVFLNPKGSMIFNGMAAEVMFLKETLNKMGIEMQAIKHGKFKGAVEPFTLDKMSDENRKQINVYLNSVFDNFIQTIGKSRGIEPAQLKQIANDFSVSNPKQALENKLVDNLSYRDEVVTAIKSALEMNDSNDDKKVSFVKMSKYLKINHPEKEIVKDHIAIIYADGNIVSGNGQDGEIGSDKFAKAIKAARENKSVKAVVLRVNSPGGSALASDIIWREALLLKKEKPLIVSMGDVAASGGYYISCIADTIVAMPNTITGSIGVFGMYPNAEKLYGKLGLHSEYVKTSEFADFGRIDRPLNAREKEVLTSFIEDIYADFVGRVSEGRGKTSAEIDSIAQGRVWTGSMAKTIGLIDVYGGLNTAIAIAAYKAGMTDVKTKAYPKQKNPFEEILESFSMASVKDNLIREELGMHYKVYQQLKRLDHLTGIQAIMPYSITPN